MILACFSQNSQEFSGSGSVFSHVSTIPKSLCIKKANILFDLVKFSNFSIRNLLKTTSLILNFVLLKYSFGNFEKRTYFADNVHCKRDGGLTKIVCSKPPILPALYIMYKTILTSTEFTYFFSCSLLCVRNVCSVMYYLNHTDHPPNAPFLHAVSPHKSKQNHGTSWQ